jgi:formylglycine-generating enzyme
MDSSRNTSPNLRSVPPEHCCCNLRDAGALNPSDAKAASANPIALESYTETVPGTDLSFEMIAVPGGTFLMGSPQSEAGRKGDEGPQHAVTLSPFWIGKVEVTWDAFDIFREACPGLPKGTPEEEEDIDGITGPTPPYGDPYRGFGGGERPVVGISWHAAMTYCLWLSETTGKLYRLPTEAEWEYACRAGSQGMFSFGDDPSQLEEYAWYAGKSDHETHRVGQKKPNAWGIHDMHGNVAEWCLDWYQADYYAAFPPDAWPPDPRGPEKGTNHLFRGGHFDTPPAKLRSAARDRSLDWWLSPDPQEPKSKWWHVPNNFLGFRVVRPLREEKPPVRESRRGL